MSPLGLAVEEVRRRLGWSQRELAGRAGVAVWVIERLEKGTRRSVPVGLVEALACVLGVPEGELWATVPGGRGEGRWVRLSE